MILSFFITVNDFLKYMKPITALILRCLDMFFEKIKFMIYTNDAYSLFFSIYITIFFFNGLFYLCSLFFGLFFSPLYCMSDSDNSGSEGNPPSYKTNESNPAPSYWCIPHNGYSTGIYESNLVDTTSINNQLTGQPDDSSCKANNSSSEPNNARSLPRSPRIYDLASLNKSSKLVNSNSCHFPEGSKENNTPLASSYSESYSLGKKD